MSHLAGSIADGINSPVNEVVHITDGYSDFDIFRRLAREASLQEELSTLTQSGLRKDMTQIRTYSDNGGHALDVKDCLNTPDTHRTLFEAILALNLALSSGCLPVYQGQDAEVLEKLDELEGLRR